ncbi:MAG: energy transducer TonB [Prevotella sp.]|nr:energy transducer TonB [Prevotella sp.]
MSKIDLISGEWTELVFAGRNQAYGAYKLRQGTGKRNVISIIAVVCLIIACQIGLTIKKAADAEAAKRAAMNQAMQLTQLEQPKKAEVKQKQVKVEPEKVVEQVKSSIKFTAPVIKKDSEVKPEDELKTQDQIMETKTAIGSFDVKGNDDVNGEVLKAKEVIAQPEPPKHEEEAKVFDVVEQMPSFPGGPSALMEYLHDHVKYPVVAQENGVQGRVVVSFIVERDGSITDVRVVRSVDPSLDREAARVVSSMPRWTPGKQNGSAVRVKYNVPVSFRLQ